MFKFHWDTFAIATMHKLSWVNFTMVLLIFLMIMKVKVNLVYEIKEHFFYTREVTGKDQDASDEHHGSLSVKGKRKIINSTSTINLSAADSHCY